MISAAAVSRTALFSLALGISLEDDAQLVRREASVPSVPSTSDFTPGDRVTSLSEQAGFKPWPLKKGDKGTVFDVFAIEGKLQFCLTAIHPCEYACMPTMSTKSWRMTKNEQSALAIFAMMCPMNSLHISWIVLLMRRTSASVSHQPRTIATAKGAQRVNRLRCASSCLVPASVLAQMEPSVPVMAIASTAAIARIHAGSIQAVSGQAIRLACGARHNWGSFINRHNGGF